MFRLFLGCGFEAPTPGCRRARPTIPSTRPLPPAAEKSFLNLNKRSSKQSAHLLICSPGSCTESVPTLLGMTNQRKCSSAGQAYSLGFLEKLSDKSNRPYFLKPASGCYGAKKAYLAVSSTTKLCCRRPLAIYQTVSRRVLLGNSALQAESRHRLYALI